MKKIFAFITMALALASCGEFIEFNGESGDPVSITLARRNIDLMVGDRYELPVSFQPADLANKFVYWLSANTEIVDFQNDTMRAVSPGSTYVTATAIAGNVTDTCRVTVHPLWQMSSAAYPYEMVIYARITAAGHEFDDSIAVAAFVGDELRGVAERKTWQGTTYDLLRIGSPNAESESITLRCYDRRRALVTELKDFISFNGETNGTISHLVPVAFE